MPALSTAFKALVTIAVAVLILGFSARVQAQDQAQLEEGAQLYAENCAVCHGANGEGRVGATLAKNWPSIRPDLEIRATIENGIAGSPMPPWSQKNGGLFTDEQVDALVLYILSWESGGPRVIAPTPTYFPRPIVTVPPNVTGDPNRGAALFDQNCVVCHGANGEGRIGAQLAKPWSSVRPDLSLKSTISTGVSGSPMPAWSLANGGPLAEAEIDDLVAFVLTLKPTGGEAQAQPTPASLPGPLADWFGIILTIVLVVLVVWVAIVLQTRGQPNKD
jgi:mono/diheme cytochrome c family protein